MKNMKRGENMQSGNSEKKGYKVKINIKVKTRGLTKEENSEIHDVLRKIKRRRRFKGKEGISSKLETEKSICVTRF